MIFGHSYAQNYDRFYATKNYGAECDFMESTWRSLRIDVRQVLDLGCGTGGHALELARRGYAVTGVDLSAEMLAVAKEKVANFAGEPPRFLQGDLATLHLEERFDAVVMMFAVVGYQTENSRLLATLRSAAAHLRPGAPLIFDCWYGPAVLAQRPTDRVRTFGETGSVELIRLARTTLDSVRQVCTVSFDMWRISPSGVEEDHEEHDMRFFFAQELRMALDVSGFDSISLSPMRGDDKHLPTEGDWNVVVVAQRR